ncbi:unnamed protein product, partial [Chrysoparadoxa australica]
MVSGGGGGAPAWTMNYAFVGENNRFDASLQYTGLDDSKVYSMWAVTFDFGAANSCAGYCAPTDLDVFGGACATGLCDPGTLGCNPTSSCGLRMFHVGGGVSQGGVFTNADDQGRIFLPGMVAGQDVLQYTSGPVDQQSQLVLGPFGGLSSRNDAIYIVLREHPDINDVTPGSGDNNVCDASGFSISDANCGRCMERRLACGCGGKTDSFTFTLFPHKLLTTQSSPYAVALLAPKETVALTQVLEAAPMLLSRPSLLLVLEAGLGWEVPVIPVIPWMRLISSSAKLYASGGFYLYVVNEVCIESTMSSHRALLACHFPVRPSCLC